MNSVRRISRPVGLLARNWRRGLATIGDALADLVFPPRCVWCETDLSPVAGQGRCEGVALCGDCRRRLAPTVDVFCRRCGAPADGLVAQVDQCRHCAGESFPWQRVVALGRYRGELSQAVVQLKRSHNEPLAFTLGQLLFQVRAVFLRELQVDVVTPMPMHWRRRLRRGTNNPELLAEVLAKCLKLPLRAGVLKRTRLTPLQVDAMPAERRLQQRKSFRIAASCGIKGRRVLLVDDVLTTGATAAEATRKLLEAGATAVSVAVLARGIGDDAL